MTEDTAKDKKNPDYHRAAAPSEGDRDLVSLLGRRSPWTRLNALEILVDNGSPFAGVAARALITDSHSELRRAAADALAYTGSALDARRLIAVTSDRSWKVRSSAVLALGRLRLRVACPVVVSRLAADPHFVVRRDAASVLPFICSDAEATLRARVGIERDTVVLAQISMTLYCLGCRERLAAIVDLIRYGDALTLQNVLSTLDARDVHRDDRLAIVHALEYRDIANEAPEAFEDAAEQIRSVLAALRAEA